MGGACCVACSGGAASVQGGLRVAFYVEGGSLACCRPRLARSPLLVLFRQVRSSGRRSLPYKLERSLRIAVMDDV